MNQTQILTELEKFKANHQQEYGIEGLGIFGSYARGEARQGSDVDVVVKLTKQDLFNIIGIKQDLEETLHLAVDVVSYRPSMDTFLKKCIDRDAVYV
ncbi:MAG: nucleotidyltransferase [Desulfobulbaceae bacterium BRH_c16a]|nr:MAG: nucleotidyltransferase [Desulfobulbaceae bacterium BRH_c16a]